MEEQILHKLLIGAPFGGLKLHCNILLATLLMTSAGVKNLLVLPFLLYRIDTRGKSEVDKIAQSLRLTKF